MASDDPPMGFIAELPASAKVTKVATDRKSTPQDAAMRRMRIMKKLAWLANVRFEATLLFFYFV